MCGIFACASHSFGMSGCPQFSQITDIPSKSHPQGWRVCGCLELAAPGFPWYGVIMEPTPFDLTPEQKGRLAALSRETGKPIPTLLAAIAAALEELQEQER